MVRCALHAGLLTLVLAVAGSAAAMTVTFKDGATPIQGKVKVSVSTPRQEGEVATGESDGARMDLGLDPDQGPFRLDLEITNPDGSKRHGVRYVSGPGPHDIDVSSFVDPAPAAMIRDAATRANEAADQGDEQTYEREVESIDEQVGGARADAEDARRAANEYADENGIQRDRPRNTLKNAEKLLKMGMGDPELIEKLRRYIRIHDDALNAEQRLREIETLRGQVRELSRAEPENDSGDQMSYVLPGVPLLSGFDVSFQGGAVSEEIGQVAVGTLILATSEEPLAINNNRFTAARTGGQISYDWGELCCARSLKTSLSYSSTNGTADGSVEEQPGGNDVGITYDEDSPAGFTGINLGATGLTGFSEVELDAQDVKLRTSLSFDACEHHDITLSPRFDLIYSGREQTARGFTWSTFDPSINTSTFREIKDHYYGGGLGLDTEWWITDHIGFYGGAGVDLLYNEAELWSLQRNLCGNPGCPALDMDFSVEIDQKRSGFVWGANANAGVAVRWDRITVRAGYTLEHLDQQATADVRYSPALSNRTSLGSTRRSARSFSIGFNYAF